MIRESSLRYSISIFILSSILFIFVYSFLDIFYFYNCNYFCKKNSILYGFYPPTNKLNTTIQLYNSNNKKNKLFITRQFDKQIYVLVNSYPFEII